MPLDLQASGLYAKWECLRKKKKEVEGVNLLFYFERVNTQNQIRKIWFWVSTYLF